MDFSDINGRYAKINGFDDYYITEYGEIYSTRPIGASNRHILHKIKPKNPGDPKKYLNVILCNDDGQYTKAVHRLVAEYFVDGYFDRAVVNHIDGNNRNNVYTNLEWTTVVENVHQSYITSGIGAKRNYKKWSLFSPERNFLGVFYSHDAVEQYVTHNNLPVSPSMLVKHRENHGYYLIVE